jgi:prefoldin subunit 5
VKEMTRANEKIDLIEKELATLTDRVEEISLALREIRDLKLEIKGIKVFLGRMHPEFKNQFPEIMQKIGD